MQDAAGSGLVIAWQIFISEWRRCSLDGWIRTTSLWMMLAQRSATDWQLARPRAGEDSDRTERATLVHCMAGTFGAISAVSRVQTVINVPHHTPRSLREIEIQYTQPP